VNPRQILLVDGPLKGQIHELHGAILPEEMGLIDPDKYDPDEIHWYALRDGKGYFLRTDRKSHTSKEAGDE